MIRYQLPILELLVDFGDELLDIVHEAKGVEIEDVRTKMLDPLRTHIRNATSSPPPPDDSPVAAETDQTAHDQTAQNDDFDLLMASAILPKTAMIPSTAS
jgi:hypothetical protein